MGPTYLLRLSRRERVGGEGVPGRDHILRGQFSRELLRVVYGPGYSLFPCSADGAELLSVAKTLDGSFLQRLNHLRKKYPAAVSSAALNCSNSVTGHTRSSPVLRICFLRGKRWNNPPERRCLDTERNDSFVTAGYSISRANGGDLIALASRGFVTAVDNDPVKVMMARRNAEVYGVADRMNVICSDVCDVTLEAMRPLDPSRRVQGRRSTSLARIEFPTSGIPQKLREAVPDCAVKLSPGTQTRNSNP